MSKLLRILSAIALVLAVLPAGVSAQSYPSQTISLVVPYSPGNGLDLLAREFADILHGALATPVVVENRAGAAGVIGTAGVARARADGHTLLFTAHPPFATAPFVVDQKPYDPLTGFLPIARVGTVPMVLVTASSQPFKTFADMAKHIRANPDKATYASSGNGSPGHLYAEQMNQATGLKMEQVPYKETGQGLIDVMAGRVLVGLASVPAATPLILSGDLRALAIGSGARLADFPDVPTMAEAIGNKDFRAGDWYAFFAPAGMTPDRLERLYPEIIKAANSERMIKFMARSNIVLDLQDPATFAKSLAADVKAAEALVGSAGLKNR